MATPIIFKEYEIAVKVEPCSQTVPLHMTLVGRACVCIPLVLMTAPIDKRGLPVASKWSVVTSPRSETFLDKVNDVFGTTFDMRQFGGTLSPTEHGDADS
jgi:hypothetical protein